MESGLEGRNNGDTAGEKILSSCVSMESGLEGRNNHAFSAKFKGGISGLNGVRPRRPEQCDPVRDPTPGLTPVSMESGLEGRNNLTLSHGRDLLFQMSQWSPA